MEVRLSPENVRHADWKILIIDDDEDDYVIVREMLSEAKGRTCNVQWASSYPAGSAALAADSFDAVLVDYDLGLHSGIELIREANQRGYPSPFILYTGRGSYDVDVEAMQAGATLYLTKNEANPLLLERAIRYAIERKQSEQALRERNEWLRKSEEKFARAFHSNPAAMVIARLPDGSFTDANDSYCHMVGYSRDELIGRSPAEIGIFSQAVLEDILDEFHRQGSIRQRDLPITARDGSTRHVLFSLDPIEAGGEPSILVTLIDITERKQAELILKKSENDLRQAGEALRDSELRLREFLENTHDNFISLDRDWRFTYANRHYGQVMGMDPRELIGKCYWDLFPQYLGTELEQNYRKVMAEGAPMHYRQCGIYTQNCYDVSVYPTYEGVAIFSIDRTDEQHHQQALEAERARLEAVLQALPVGVWISDEKGAILGKNPQADRIWAGDAPMVEGVEQYQEYESWDARSGQKLAAEDYPLAVVLRTGQPVQPVEHRIRRFDGSTGYVLVSATPIKDGDGQLLGALAINLDITGRKEDEVAMQENAAALQANAEALEAYAEALKNSLEINRARAKEMETLMDTVPALIWIARDTECRQMAGNRYGYEFLQMWQGANISKTAADEDLDLQPYRNFKNGREIPTNELPMQVAAATGQPASNFDFDLVFKDGTVRTVLGNVNPLFDEAGRPSGAVAAFMDITEQRQAQEQLKHYAQELERSNQALQDFAFIASHDLQEPLRKVLLFGESLRKQLGEGLDETSAEYLSRMQSAAQRMHTMINGLLELSRVNTLGAEFTPVQLTGLVAEVVSDLEARIQAVQGQVQVETLPDLEADALQMRQLFLNLIGNAIKFHQPDLPPRVRVTGRLLPEKRAPGDYTTGRDAQGPWVEIRVEDNGIGFEQNQAARIFQPFQRLHSRSEYEGTGLGLAICQKIVERHHGQIEVHSQPGAGSVFTIRMPAKAG